MFASPARKMALSLVLAAGLISGAVAQVEPESKAKPAWRCLPAETVVALRLPHLKRFQQALDRRTHFGREVLSDQLWTDVRKMLEEEGGADWEQFNERLSRYGLEPADAGPLLGRGVGAALALAPRPQRTPALVVLGWANPGPEVGRRIMDAVGRSVAEVREEAEFPPRRYDIEVAGHEVMHLSFPVTGPDRSVSFDPPDDFAQMSPEQQRKFFQQRQKEQQQARTIVLDRANVLLTRKEGRLLLVMTVGQSRDRVRSMKPAEREQIDWPKLTALPQARRIFGRFLRNHQGEDGQFVARVRSTPGLVDAMPEGTPLLKLFADPSALMRMGQGDAQRDQSSRFGKFMELVRQTGLDGLGPIAARACLEGQALRSGSFVSAPAPRSGLLKLLEQPALAAAPARWVSRDPVAYNHFSLDLAQVYRRIKRIAIQQGGASVEKGFQLVEGNVKAQTQVPLPEILAALGHRHMLVSFKPGVKEVKLPDRANRDPKTGEMPKKTVKMPQSRLAFVWELDAVKPWQQVLKAAGRFAATAPIEQVKEQGFTGWRMDQGPMSGGLFLGHGYLTLTLGDEVSAPTLASLRNPPGRDSALRDSKLHARARQLLPPRDGLSYSLGDFGRYAQGMRRMIVGAMRQSARQSEDAEARRVANRIKQLAPEAEQLRRSFGVTASQTRLTDDGLAGSTVLHLPPPSDGD